MKKIAHKYSDFSLSLGILLAGIFVLFLFEFIPISDFIWHIVFVVSILLTGIPHGALDHLVEKKHAELNGQRFQLTTFLLNYIIRMVLYGIVWWVSPTIGLIVFFVISGWHFGETDLQYITGKNKVLDWLMATTYGLFVLAVLLLNHIEETAEILSYFPSPGWDTSLMKLENTTKTLLQNMLGILFLSVFVFHLIFYKGNFISYLYVFISLAVLVLLLIELPLLVGFTVYFSWWHSLRTLHRIAHFLETQTAEIISIRQLAVQAIPFSLLAFLGIAGLVWWGGYSGQMSLVLVGLFIGIALLTAPHLEVMGKLFRYPSQAND